MLVLQEIFTVLIVLQFVLIVSHDLLDIPGWTHGKQVQAVVGRRKLLLATAINSIFPGAAVALALLFLQRCDLGEAGGPAEQEVRHGIPGSSACKAERAVGLKIRGEDVSTQQRLAPELQCVVAGHINEIQIEVVVGARSSD